MEERAKKQFYSVLDSRQSHSTAFSFLYQTISLSLPCSIHTGPIHPTDSRPGSHLRVSPLRLPRSPPTRLQASRRRRALAKTPI